MRAMLLPYRPVMAGDRTFIDEAGVRWVVDYKTTNRPDEMPLDAFLADQAEKYQKQLHIYATLFNHLS